MTDLATTLKEATEAGMIKWEKNGEFFNADVNGVEYVATANQLIVDGWDIISDNGAIFKAIK